MVINPTSVFLFLFFFFFYLFSYFLFSLAFPLSSTHHHPSVMLSPSFSSPSKAQQLPLAVTMCQNRWNQLLTLSSQLPATTSSLIERINEWSICEIIWCHGTCSTLCEREGGTREGWCDPTCITNSVLPQRQCAENMSVRASPTR